MRKRPVLAARRLHRSWLTVVATGALLLGGMTVAAVADPAATPARTWSVKGRVLAILPIGDRIYVGGSFTAVVDTSGISYPVSNLAVFSRSSGAADLSFDADPSGVVTSLTTDGSSLFLGGAFSSVANGGIAYPRSNVAAVALDTGLLSSWRVTVSGGQVDTLAYSAGSLVLGGNFTSVRDVDGTYAPNAYLASVRADSGSVNVGFAPSANGRVRTVNVAANGSGLYIGGDFSSVAGLANTRAIARIDPLSGGVDGTFRPAPTNSGTYAPVFDITSDPSRVYLGVAGSGGACTALTAASGAAVWSHHANGNLQSVRLIGPTLYCGGHFSGTGSFDGLTRNKLAAVDAATGTILSFAPNVGSTLGVWSMGTQPGDASLYIGGDFTKVAGVNQPHLATFFDQGDLTAPSAPRSLVAQGANGSVWLSWLNPSSDGGSAVTRFKVYRSTTAGGQNLSGTPLTTVKASATVAIPTFQDTTVTNGTTYYYRVVALNAVGTGIVSVEDPATPDTSITVVPPSAPVSFSLSNPPGSMQLTWNPPLDSGGAPATSYNVYRSTSPGAEGTIPYASGITTTSFSDVYNLVAGTTYYYRISAVNTAGEGVLSYETYAVEQPGKPGAPVLSASLSGGVVHLWWTVPPDGGSPITKYVLTRNAVRLKNLTSSTTSTYDSTVKAGSQYTYQVRAVNAYGNGKMSNSVTVTIP